MTDWSIRRNFRIAYYPKNSMRLRKKILAAENMKQIMQNQVKKLEFVRKLKYVTFLKIF